MVGFGHFPEELVRRGEPDLRPAVGKCVLSRTPGMVARERALRGRALLATLYGERSAVSPEQVVEALEDQYGVRRSEVKVEVTAPPDDFLLRFVYSLDCTRVLHHSRHFCCGGGTLSFCRWYRGRGSHSSELGYLTKLVFDHLPEEAWETKVLGNLVNRLDGVLVEKLPPDDRWSVSVLAWMKEPSKVPKQFIVELSEPWVPPRYNVFSDNEDQSMPSPPCSPEKKRTFEHDIIIHV
ncbi:hypothetical protein ACQ4PT_051974 [Festuca glaucescens]